MNRNTPTGPDGRDQPDPETPTKKDDPGYDDVTSTEPEAGYSWTLGDPTDDDELAPHELEQDGPIDQA